MLLIVKKEKQFIGNSVGYGEEDKPIMGDISPNDYNYFWRTLFSYSVCTIF